MICTSAVLWKHFPLVTFPCDLGLSSCCQVPGLPPSPSPSLLQASSLGNRSVLTREMASSDAFSASCASACAPHSLWMPLFILKLQMGGSRQAGTKDGVLQELCVLTWPLSEPSQ